MKGKSNYEKIILALVALGGLGGSAWFAYSSLGFGDSLKTDTPAAGKDFGVIPVELVDQAIKRVVEPSPPWIAPLLNGKAAPLNKSVLLVFKENQIYDLFLEDKQLWPPLTNAFLRENDLPNVLSPNVGDLDPDNDGFSNREEFDGHTSPRDPASHPPITNKLFLAMRHAKDYKITLKSSGTPYQIATPDDTGRRAYFLEEGPDKTFGANGRFSFLKFEKKVVPDDVTGEKDVSELTVRDNERKNEVVLVYNQVNNIADYSAEFEFRLKKVSRWKVEKGGNFRIPGYDNITYRLIDVQEETAVIAPVNTDGSVGTEILIKRA